MLASLTRALSRHADLCALEGEDGRGVSYRELDEESQRAARRLEALGWPTHAPRRVALLLGRRSLVPALIACWRAGVTPVILSPSWPDERRERILAECGACHVLGDTGTGGLDQARLIPSPAPPPTASPCEHEGIREAYVIYSSGSSGRPKGVLVSFDGLAGMIEAQIKTFRMSPSCRCLWLHESSFDASISDIFTALLSGSTLCWSSSDENVAKLLGVIERRRITHADIPPSLLNLLPAERCPACLQTVVVGGETTPLPTVRAWAKRLRLVNVYGPTEATVCTSMHVCTGEEKALPIGRAIPGIRYRVATNPDMPAQPEGVGELTISGAGVALGYLGQPELTRERFAFRNGTREFHTGDLVRKEGEELVFVGRADRQRKINGRLLCPEEIEAALVAHPRVEQARVILDGDADGGIRAQVASGSGVRVDELDEFLGRKLPKWMIPRRWSVDRQLTPGPNGKLGSAISQNKDDPPPALPRRILDLMRQACGIPELTASCRFFAHADSLAGLRLLALADRAGIPLTPDHLTPRTSAESLASDLESPQVGYLRSTAMLRRLAGWHARSLMPPDHRPAPCDRSTSPVILLTGATGGLGREILRALLARGEPMEILCLIRGPHADRRLAGVLAEIDTDSTPGTGQTVHALPGDLERPRFGIATSRWSSLAWNVSHVIHAAAFVDLLADLRRCSGPNILGTRRVLELVRSGRAKHLVHVSSLSVFVDAEDCPPLCEEGPLPDGTRIFGGYAQSKWAAEALVENAVVEDGHTTSVVRPGLLVPAVENPVPRARDWFCTYLRSLQANPHLPQHALKPDAAMDFTPVDLAARAIAAISLRDAPVPLERFHLANAHPLTRTVLAAAIGRLSGDCSGSGFTSHLAESSRRLASFDLFKATGTSFDCRNTRRLIGRSFDPPVPDEDFMTAYLQRFSEPCPTVP